MNPTRHDAMPAFEVARPEGARPALIVCDHASNRVPADLAGLGLASDLLLRHIAWDIGAAELSRRLADLLDVPAVLSGASRLVIDCNRRLDDPSSIPAASDGIAIPGNRNLSGAARAARAARWFEPYHAETLARLDAWRARGRVVPVISVHSFTPVMNGFERPWHVGLLYDRDDSLARPLIAALAAEAGLVVGDNQPYSGREPRSYGIETLGGERGHPMAVFEVRQDLIDTRHGAHDWAERLARVLRPLLPER